MKNIITFFTFSFYFLSSFQNAIGQDAMVIGFNFDNPDGASVVALKDIPDTQNIFVTENNYDAGTNTFNRADGVNNGTVRITWTGTWTKGTIIGYEETSSNVLTTTPGPGAPADAAVTILYGDGFSYSSEGFSTFTSASATDPDASPTEIYSYVRAETASGAADPNPNDDGDCPCSANFITVDLLGTFNTDYGDFKVPPRSSPISISGLTNPANWNSGATYVSLDLTPFVSIALPIALRSFQATKRDNVVRIEWETLIEINNEFFTVERSLDGTRFEAIGTIRGAGNSFVPLSYKFVDMAPAGGFNYYRLKQTDYDGAFTYSEIESLDFRSAKEVSQVYPNPFDQFVTMQFSSSEYSSSVGARTIEVYDIYGKLVLSTEVPAEETNITIDLSILNSGAYFLHTLDGQYLRTSIQRIIKL